MHEYKKHIKPIKALEGIEGEFGKVILVNLISYSKYKSLQLWGLGFESNWEWNCIEMYFLLIKTKANTLMG